MLYKELVLKERGQKVVTRSEHKARLKVRDKGSILKWQHRRILGSAHPTNTLNQQLYMDRHPLKKKLGVVVWRTPVYQANKGRPTSKWGGEAGTQSCHTPHPGCSIPQSQGNSNPIAVLWKAKCWKHTLDISAFKNCTWEMSQQNTQLWEPAGLAFRRPTCYSDLRNGS